jgi:glycosyltransferase involved in cell wall biosynthesis
MYLIPITVPIYLDGTRRLIATDWKRALELLRDSHGGRYGPLAVMAPHLPASAADQVLVEPTPAGDEIELIPAFDDRLGARAYWSAARKAVTAKLHALLPRVKLVHGTAEDPFRPFTWSAFMDAVRDDIPSVFVQDQDVASVVRELNRHDGVKQRLKAELHARLHEHHCRRAVTAAGVSFLKGRGTIQRYRDCSAHIEQVEDTSYFTSEIVGSVAVDERLRALLEGARPLRFGFCGRLVDIKGVDRSLRIVARARAAGANVALDIIGTGPDDATLKSLAAELRLGDAATFVGAMPYGPALLARLSQCDALLFNPRMEETPRMIFDGYAAGLPLVAGGIDYVHERADADHAAVVLPRDDDAAAAAVVVELDRDRARVAALTRQALAAAHHHAADNWYARRARWTAEMVERHWHGRTPPAARAPRAAA